MRLARVRAVAPSVLAGGFLTLGVLASLPTPARAGTMRLTAASSSSGTSASASASTAHHVPAAAGFQHADPDPHAYADEVFDAHAIPL